jgi:hypothetical protein
MRNLTPLAAESISPHGTRDTFAGYDISDLAPKRFKVFDSRGLICFIFPTTSAPDDTSQTLGRATASLVSAKNAFRCPFTMKMESIVGTAHIPATATGTEYSIMRGVSSVTNTSIFTNVAGVAATSGLNFTTNVTVVSKALHSSHSIFTEGDFVSIFCTLSAGSNGPLATKIGFYGYRI